MNKLIPVDDRDNTLAEVKFNTETVDWHVSNMTSNTIRAYENAVNKIDAWLDGLPLNDATLARFIKQMCESENQYSLSAVRIVVATEEKSYDNSRNLIDHVHAFVHGNFPRIQS